jgi:hypothetical protein
MEPLDDYGLNHRAGLDREKIDEAMLKRLKRSGNELESGVAVEAAIELQRKLDSGRVATLLAPLLNFTGSVFGQAVIAQAARICMQAADALADRHVQLDISRIEERYNVWLTFDALEREANAYLEAREHLDELIADYRGIIDPIGSHGKSIEVTCGLVLKWLDEQIEIDYLERKIEDDSAFGEE